MCPDCTGESCSWFVHADLAELNAGHSFVRREAA
jgi:hypothetical protein